MSVTIRLYKLRPLWIRPRLRAFGISAGLILVLSIFATVGNSGSISYRIFLDQLNVGNVSNNLFRGMDIDGHLKQLLNVAVFNGGTRTDTFHSRVPDFSDPALLSELRKRHIAIDAASSSQWLSFIGGRLSTILIILGAFVLAKPILLVFAAALIASLAGVSPGKRCKWNPSNRYLRCRKCFGMFRVYSASSRKMEAIRHGQVTSRIARQHVHHEPPRSPYDWAT